MSNPDNLPDKNELFSRHHQISQELNTVYETLETLNSRKSALRSELAMLTQQIQKLQQEELTAQAGAIVEEKAATLGPIPPRRKKKKEK